MCDLISYYGNPVEWRIEIISRPVSLVCFHWFLTACDLIARQSQEVDRVFYCLTVRCQRQVLFVTGGWSSKCTFKTPNTSLVLCQRQGQVVSGEWISKCKSKTSCILLVLCLRQDLFITEEWTSRDDSNTFFFRFSCCMPETSPNYYR